MAKSKFFSLWGQRAEDAPSETDEEKAAREKAEKEAAADKDEDEETAEAEDPDDEEDEDEKEMAQAAAKVPARVARHIRRAERARVHAIVDGAGPDCVEAALHVAFNTDMDARAAVTMIKALPASSAASGKLGLRAEMATRRQPPLGVADQPAGGATDADKAAAFILKAGKAA